MSPALNWFSAPAMAIEAAKSKAEMPIAVFFMVWILCFLVWLGVTLQLTRRTIEAERGFVKNKFRGQAIFLIGACPQ